MNAVLVAEALKAVPLFAALTERELEEIAGSVRRVRFPKKSIVFQEGDPGDYLLLLQKGRVKVTLLGEGGQETILAMLEPPAFLGEISLLDDAPRSATVVAMEPTEFLRLARDAFIALIRKHPQMAFTIMASVARSLRYATEQVRTLSMFDVHGRVLRALLVLAQRQGATVPTSRILVKPKPALKDVALMIGCSRETVSRAMRDLHEGRFVTATVSELAIEHRAIRRYLLPTLQNLAAPEGPSSSS